MSSQNLSERRLDSLTGLRFVAAVIVFVTHGSIEFVFSDPGTTQNYLIFAGKVGQISLSYFFVLSGFVLTWAFRPEHGASGFWRRRFFRIYPSHVVTFVAAIVLMALTDQQIGLRQSLANLFLVQDWVPDNSYLDSANGVSWSLSAEVLFYLCFPLLVVLINKIRPSRLWYWVGAATVAVMLVPLFSLTFLPDSPRWWWGPASWVQIWFVNVFPVTRLLEFVLGILLARIVLTGRRTPGILPAALLVVAAYAGQLFLPLNFLYSYAAISILPVVLLIPAVAAADLKGRRTFLANRTMVRLGDTTFAFYLVHNLVLRFGHRAFGLKPNAFHQLSGPQWGTLGGIAFLAGSFAVALLLSWALYAFVERPAMNRWSRPAAARAERREQPAPGELLPTGS